MGVVQIPMADRAALCDYCGKAVEQAITCEVCGATVCAEHNKEYGCAVCQGKTSM